MSEVQAKETESEISTGPAELKPEGFTIEPDEVGVTDGTVIETAPEETPNADGEEVTLKVEEDAPIEIKVEEGGTPSPRRLSRFDKRIKSKNAEIDQTNSELEAEREKNKLLQLALDQSKTIKEPDEDTFEGSDTEFKAAQKAWNQQEITRIAAEQAQNIVTQAVQTTTQVSQDAATQEINDAHYKRADTLKVSNYDELEGSAVDIIGDDFAQVLIASTENAHKILASMGAYPGKTAKIAELAKSNPSKAFADALTFEIHPSLKPASKPTLDPEEHVLSGSGLHIDSGEMKHAIGAKFE